MSHSNQGTSLAKLQARLRNLSTGAQNRVPGIIVELHRSNKHLRKKISRDHLKYPLNHVANTKMLEIVNWD